MGPIRSERRNGEIGIEIENRRERRKSRGIVAESKTDCEKEIETREARKATPSWIENWSANCFRNKLMTSDSARKLRD
jgi:hypothetical protein